MDSENRIKVLAEHLIWAINQAYNDSELIQEALSQIDAEGYRVDILLAAFTRFDSADAGEAPSEQIALISQKRDDPLSHEEEEEETEEDFPLSAELNEFDRTFLKLIKVGYLDEG